MGKLYIIGTPIGNLGDFSSRGISTLKEVDFIAAEDTRVSRKLLTHFEISTPITSYHQHNSHNKGKEIVTRILNGENCGLITDAGMPAISDPGENLVRLCQQSNITVVTVPGPTAFASALAISGINSRRFVFEGFLEGKPSEKRATLLEVRDYPQTIIYYESPHRIEETLQLMFDVFGNRNIAICREITKIHEEVLRFSLSEAASYYSKNLPRGEFVLIVEGKEPNSSEEILLEDAVKMVIVRDQQGVSLSKAAKEVAEITGHQKNTLYRTALETKDQNSRKNEFQEDIIDDK